MAKGAGVSGRTRFNSSAAVLDRPTHASQGWIGQQMQDPYEPPCVHHGGRVLFQFSELRRNFKTIYYWSRQLL